MADQNPTLKRELEHTDESDLIKALDLVRFWRDPASKALWPLTLIGIGGFIGIAIGYRAAARTLAVPLQTPALVSGGLAGLALVGLACLLTSIHMSRGDAARERREIDGLLDEARLLLEVAPKLRRSQARPAAKATAASTAATTRVAKTPAQRAARKSPAKSAR